MIKIKIIFWTILMTFCGQYSYGQLKCEYSYNSGKIPIGKDSIMFFNDYRYHEFILLNDSLVNRIDYDGVSNFTELTLIKNDTINFLQVIDDDTLLKLIKCKTEPLRLEKILVLADKETDWKNSTDSLTTLCVTILKVNSYRNCSYNIDYYWHPILGIIKKKEHIILEDCKIDPHEEFVITQEGIRYLKCNKECFELLNNFSPKNTSIFNSLINK